VPGRPLLISVGRGAFGVLLGVVRALWHGCVCSHLTHNHTAVSWPHADAHSAFSLRSAALRADLARPPCSAPSLEPGRCRARAPRWTLRWPSVPLRFAGTPAAGLV